MNDIQRADYGIVPYGFCDDRRGFSGAGADTPPAGRWTAGRAEDWYRSRPWPVGCNFIPSTAINPLEMWQADSFDLPTIDRELGWAQGLGFNCVRVFLHDLLWQQDREGFLERMDQFLGVADKHHVRVMFVLLDSCWDPNPKLGRQHEPTPHVHNSGWVQAPGKDVLADETRWERELKPYIQGVIGHFKDDRRVYLWDLHNEADNTNGSAYGAQDLTPAAKSAAVMKLLPLEFAWAREVNPTQPLSVCAWSGEWSDEQKLSPFNRLVLDQSDVITFHNYKPLAGMKHAVESLRRYHRPLVCTEYMARPIGSTFEAVLPYLKAQRVGAFNWGFVAGKTQTQYPWDSWQKAYTGEPPLWFHEIFRPDGTPYKADEVEVIRRETGAK